eukprot:TRINITY_DN4558_c0_g1_i9.p1 TRINITY_DN4558_c0_g1~~TRINITY_DN4558_c0_g1_i9.p1  ORF type:complete len:221 (-),score=41.17 TRINITY_DN4558_c0_g1_i9:248-910(-)
MFLDLDDTVVTLFAFMNGDGLHAAFKALGSQSSMLPLARIYMYTFVLLFITVVRNVFIFIMQDGYHLGKVLSLDSTADLKSHTNVDNDSLLLWKVGKSILDVRKLFDIIDDEYPVNHTRKKSSKDQSKRPDEHISKPINASGSDVSVVKNSKTKMKPADVSTTKTTNANVGNTLSKDRPRWTGASDDSNDLYVYYSGDPSLDLSFILKTLLMQPLILLNK